MKKNIFLYIVISCLQLNAQHTKKLATVFLKEKHPFYITNSLLINNEELPNNYATISAMGYLAKNDFKHPFIPTKKEGLNIYSEGFKKIKKYTIYGTIVFNEEYQNNNLGINTIQSKHLTPYYLLDTLQKNWKRQNINLKTQISNTFTNSNWFTELGLGYKAIHKVNYTYPKPLLYSYNFSITPSLGYNINKNHKIAISYRYKNLKDELKIDDGSVTKVQIFSVTGLGNLTNKNGFGSNYRFTKGNTHKASIKGFSSFKNKKEISYLLSLEKLKQNGFNDIYKSIPIFNYDEWLSHMKVQLKIRNNVFINYNLLFQSGKGIHKKPKENTTFTKKLRQSLQLAHYNSVKKQVLAFNFSHTKKREANSFYSNFYEFDYFSISSNYYKTIPITNNFITFKTGINYQLPINQEKQFLKSNVFINNYIHPYLDYYQNKFLTFSFSPKLTITTLKKAILNIGINNNLSFNLSNKMNTYNSFYLSIDF